MEKKLEDMIVIIKEKDALDIARGLKEKWKMVSGAYEELCDCICEREKNNGHFPSTAQKIADKAEGRAEDLYCWAESIAETPSSSRVDESVKEAQIKQWPCVVAQAYAMQVRFDARMVKSCSIVDDGERRKYQEMSRDIKNVLIEKIRGKIRTIILDTSLLDMALDYHLPVLIYTKLIDNLQREQKIQQPEDMRESTEALEDGLSKLR